MTVFVVKSEKGKYIKPTSKQRYYWIDFAKSISIFGVVFIHSCGLALSSYFRFCVPIFITISFFLVERAQISKQGVESFSAIGFYQKRLPRLMVPYVFWSLLYTIGQYVLGIRDSIEFSPTFSWQGQYFFVVLIQLTLLYPLVRLIRISLIGVLSAGIVTLLLFASSSYFGLTIPFPISGEAPFFYWMFYMVLGIYFARDHHRSLLINATKMKQSTRLKIIFILPLFIFVENKVLLLFGIDAGSYSRTSVLIISSLMFGMMSTLQFTHTPKVIRLSIALLSKWSLGIFCLNPIIIRVIHQTYDYVNAGIGREMNPYSSILVALLTTLMTLVAAIFVSQGMARIRLRSLVV